jgi:streptogramin lyase
MLPRRSVRALFPLPDGEVWVTTTANGLFRGRGARLEEVPLPNTIAGAPTASISQVALSEKGSVLFVRGAEVWQVQGKKIERLAERTAAVERLLQKDLTESERGRAVRVGAVVAVA